MDAVIAFYTSTDPKITLSTKLLEVVFVLIGLVRNLCGHFKLSRQDQRKAHWYRGILDHARPSFYCGQVDSFGVDRRWPYCYAASGSVQAGRTW